MLRLIGILTGSAIAVALLIVALGLPALTSPVEGPVSEPVELPQIGAPPEPEISAMPQIGAIPEPEPEPVPEVQAIDADVEAVIDELFAQREPIEENWYAFWSPFRSEIAANGFVAKLQEKTGIDYRVVKVETGVYEVAFAYTDDADIATKLDRITMATGLDMSGS
jgi:hypothetical protein